MSIQQWSVGRLVIAAIAWLLGFPVLFLAAVLLVGNLGFTIPTLAVVAVLWLGPIWWLVSRWRRGRGGRVAGDAA
jgi:hypothetical protein